MLSLHINFLYEQNMGLILLVFAIGYLLIALEHPIKINKTATALLLGVVLWTIYALSCGIFGPIQGIACGEEWRTVLHNNLILHLGNTAEIVFFLLGAMTIVTLVDEYQGFRLITDLIKTNNKRKLLWILSFITFFLSAVLDNMTTSIVMAALLRKLIADKKERWLFAGMIILAANAGGAWSPIGDVTTIMLWIGGQVTTFNIMVKTFLASMVCMIVPVMMRGAQLKGDFVRPQVKHDDIIMDKRYRILIFTVGIAALIFVPIFKTITHLPPYLGMLFGVAVLWVITEIISRKNEKKGMNLPTAASTLEHIDTPSILFFLGILMAVACLETCGALGKLSLGLNNTFIESNIKIGGEPAGFFIIDLIIGIISSIVDNVPLVAGTMGMYPIGIEDPTFIINHPFWEFLAYCAGTGGSLLIIGSAAGVAVMGMEKIDFIWYLKKISWLALVGYIAGAIVYIITDITLFEKIDWLKNLV